VKKQKIEKSREGIALVLRNQGGEYKRWVRG